MKDNKKILIVIITIGIILMIPLYVAMFKLGGKLAEKEQEIIDNSNQDVDNNDEINDSNMTLQERVEYLISNELEQLIPLKSLNELSNQDKLQTILNLYIRKNGYTETINKETLNNIFKASSIRNLGVEYTDVCGDNLLEDSTAVVYRLEGDVYLKEPAHGSNLLNTIYKEVIDYKESENKITISYKYAFSTALGDGPVPINLYYNYEDALNKQNKIITYDPMDYITDEDMSGYSKAMEEAKKYDFSKELDKLDTYTYTFELVGNDLVLVDFNRK